MARQDEPLQRSRQPAGPKTRARLVVTLSCLFAAPLLVELGLRFMLFGPTEIGTSFRDPGRYADPMLDDDYWRLRYILSKKQVERSPSFDPILGWRSELMEAGNYAHKEKARVRGRRPILLYGASFAKGGKRRDVRFEALVEASDLAPQFCLLNYAVGGQGVDQTYLTLQHTLPHFAGQNPVVVIGLVAETDFDRCALSFRDYPKPRFELSDGQLRLREVIPSIPEYLSEHPVTVRSYAWNHLVYGAPFVPRAVSARLTGRARKLHEKRELIRAIILGMQRTLEDAGVDYFFLLFHAHPFLEEGSRVSWQEEFVTRVFERNAVPYVCTRAPMLAFARRNDVPTGALYRRANGHLSATGNAAALDAIRLGLKHEFTTP